jgi:hypothetical protein
LLNFAGLKVTTCIQHVNKPGIKVMHRRNTPSDLARDPSTLTWNLSSGACAINLAAHFGVRKIVLLGYDMRKIEDAHNWHTDYGPPPPKKNPYARFMRPFPGIAASLSKMRIECVNATPGSALDVFPIVSLKEALSW